MATAPETVTVAADSVKAVATQAVAKLGSGDWMITVMYIVVIAWIALVAVFLAKLARRYTLFDKKAWTKDTHPFLSETMAMPRGVFRAVITMSLLLIVLLMEIVSLAHGGLESTVGQLLTAFQMMLAFYFGGKVMHHLAAVDKKKEEARQETERVTVEAAAIAASGGVAADHTFRVEGAEG